MSAQIKDLITAQQLQTVTTDICEKTINNFVTKVVFEKEIEKVTESVSEGIEELAAVAKSGDYNDLINAPYIPEKTSDITNDSGFITSEALPTNVSELSNDTGFITSADLPTKISDLSNDTGFITSAALPTKTSDLINDDEFITNAVNDLVNYYLKAEVYTKSEVDTITTAIKNSRFEVVNELPTEDIKTNVIYLVPKSSAQSSNAKDEYINLNGTVNGWEKIGDTEIDLSGYATTQDMNTALANYTTTVDLNNILINYTQSADLATVATTGAYSDLTGIPDPLTAGDGINIANNIISTDNLQPEDMADIVTHSASPITVGHALGDIENVALSSPTDGQVLAYDGTNSVWKNANVTAFNYSSSEQIAGNWVDGSILYQKTFVDNLSVSADTETDLVALPVGAKVHDIEGVLYTPTTSIKLNHNVSSTMYACVWTQNGYIKIKVGSNVVDISDLEYQLTIKYTK